MENLPPLGNAIIGYRKDGRPIILNPPDQSGQYSLSTERTITVSDPRLNGGKPTLIPSIYQGQSVPQERAVEIILQNGGVDPDTGAKVRSFPSFEAADKFARKRSRSFDEELAPYFEMIQDPDKLNLLLRGLEISR